MAGIGTNTFPQVPSLPTQLKKAESTMLSKTPQKHDLLINSPYNPHLGFFLSELHTRISPYKAAPTAALQCHYHRQTQPRQALVLSGGVCVLEGLR